LQAIKQGRFGRVPLMTKDCINSNKFRYHSHFEIQRGDGLFGGLIVHKPLGNGGSEAFKHYYDDEFLIMVGDWYHRDATEVQASYVNHDSWGREVCLLCISINTETLSDDNLACS
jgi:FtsP/CotA-like multicopper oxidase with cupredoxin domain